MLPVDAINNLNDLIIELEALLCKDRKKDLLIRESFVLWYILIEGVNCENFTEEEIQKLLVKNYNLFKSNFLHEPNFSFIMGWMINVSPWYFDSSIDETYGNALMLDAYKKLSKNSFFKWGVRDQLNLSTGEINNLKTDISARFDEFYDYGPIIKQYFLDVINTSHL